MWTQLKQNAAQRDNSYTNTDPPYTHYNDVIMGAIASQITSLTIVYSIVYSDADRKKHQSSASLAFVRGNHRGPVNSPHKWPVTRKMFPFDDIIMQDALSNNLSPRKVKSYFVVGKNLLFVPCQFRMIFMKVSVSNSNGGIYVCHEQLHEYTHNDDLSKDNYQNWASVEHKRKHIDTRTHTLVQRKHVALIIHTSIIL